LVMIPLVHKRDGSNLPTPRDCPCDFEYAPQGNPLNNVLADNTDGRDHTITLPSPSTRDYGCSTHSYLLEKGTTHNTTSNQQPNDVTSSLNLHPHPVLNHLDIHPGDTARRDLPPFSVQEDTHDLQLSYDASQLLSCGDSSERDDRVDGNQAWGLHLLPRNKSSLTLFYQNIKHHPSDPYTSITKIHQDFDQTSCVCASYPSILRRRLRTK